MHKTTKINNNKNNSKNKNSKKSFETSNKTKNTTQIDNNKKIKITQWNCNGLISKITIINQYLINDKPDLMLPNEIKCENAKTDPRVKLDNYVIEDKCRNKNGGGVAILIRKDIKYEQITALDHLNLELVAIKIKINNINTIVVTWYNRPQSTIKKEVFEILLNLNESFILGTSALVVKY